MDRQRSFTLIVPTEHDQETEHHYPLPGGEASLQVRLEQNDCVQFLNSLEDDSVDLIVTDPAYSGMNNRLKLGRGRIVGEYAARGDEDARWFAEFDDSEENYHSFLSACRRVLNPETGHVYIMFDSYSLLSLGHLVREYFDVKNIITWDKLSFGMGHYFRRQHEFIIFATCGNSRKIRNRSFPDVWRFRRIRRAEYATQKPVELFQAMVYASSEEGFTVCDPFVGSGSSAIAAIKNGCSFLGCDTSPKAVETAARRVQIYLQDGHDVLQPKPAHVAGEKVFWE
jgi:site-specific DNA-methyltransferase (adenine-specific)